MKFPALACRAHAESFRRNQDLEWASKASAFITRARNPRHIKSDHSELDIAAANDKARRKPSIDAAACARSIFTFPFNLHWRARDPLAAQATAAAPNLIIGWRANINKKGATHATLEIAHASVCVCVLIFDVVVHTRRREEPSSILFDVGGGGSLPRGARRQMQPIWRLLALSLARRRAMCAGNENCIIWWAGGRAFLFQNPSQMSQFGNCAMQKSPTLVLCACVHGGAKFRL